MTSYGVLTFDCYGTLVDWERGIVDACREAARADGVALDPATILAIHAEAEPAIQADGFRNYRAVLTEVALVIARDTGWRLSRDRAGFLAESVPTWPPFPDTNPALEALSRRGFRLGILSNVDDDLLAGTLRHLRARFDLLVTAEQVRAYKPAPAHFHRARARIGARTWLHVAQSFFHDIAPALNLGIPAIWVNRKAEQPPEVASAPLAEVRDLEELAAWLEKGDR